MGFLIMGYKREMLAAATTRIDNYKYMSHNRRFPYVESKIELQFYSL